MLPILMLPILSLSLSLSAASSPTATFPAASRFNFRGSDCAYYVAGQYGVCEAVDRAIAECSSRCASACRVVDLSPTTCLDTMEAGDAEDDALDGWVGDMLLHGLLEDGAELDLEPRYIQGGKRGLQCHFNLRI